MCRIRYFSEQCHQAIVDGRIKGFVYLSAGQEAAPAAVAWAFRNKRVNVFCQHRNHGAYIAFGGDVTKLRDELLGLPTGTTGGIGGDPCHAFQNDRVKMLGHDGLVGSQVPIAVGMALASGEQSIVFCGDATVEEDYFFPAVGFAQTKQLPVIIVCEDNDLSVITDVETRRSWDATSVAAAYELNSYSFTADDPFNIALKVEGWHRGFIQIPCERMYRHVGAGMDRAMKHDRLEITRNQLFQTSPFDIAKIEAEAREEMRKLWQE